METEPLLCKHSIIRAARICQVVIPHTIFHFYFKSFCTFKIPLPCRITGIFKLSQLFFNLIFTSSLVKFGSFDNNNATAPLTTGVAIEVPLFLAYKFPS